jgi:phage-related protein
VYAVGFISSLLQGYYSTVMYDFIHSKLWNPAYRERIPVSKRWAQIIVTVEPLLDWMLDVVQFFVTMTMRFQFILPQLLGQVLVDLPYGLMKIDENRFTS